MKNQNLKLEFIETGRLSNGEMTEIVGGATHCGTYTPCPHGESNKSNCNNYRHCESITKKGSWCETYNNFVIGVDNSLELIEKGLLFVDIL
jgi:hypothetical protein